MEVHLRWRFVVCYDRVSNCAPPPPISLHQPYSHVHTWPPHNGDVFFVSSSSLVVFSSTEFCLHTLPPAAPYTLVSQPLPQSMWLQVCFGLSGQVMWHCSLSQSPCHVTWESPPPTAASGQVEPPSLHVPWRESALGYFLSVHSSQKKYKYHCQINISVNGKRYWKTTLQSLH